MNRYGEFSKKLCYFTTYGGDFIFIFCKKQQNYFKNPHKIFI
eukprot:UN07050